MRVVAIDIGATNLRAALFNNENAVRVEKTLTPRTNGDDLINVMEELVKKVAPDRDFQAIGIASIGPLDLSKGMLLWAPNLGYGNVRLRDSMGESFKRPVYLVNDAMAGAWAEKVLGRGREMNDLAYITMSTGLGVGAVVDGNLLVGRRGNAHELGHSVVNFDQDVKCGCGGTGHWEAYVGGRNIPRTAQLLTSSWRGAHTRAYEDAARGAITPEELYLLAKSGDEFAMHVVDFINMVHAAGIATLVAAYDPEAIFIGGSIYLYNEDIIKPGVLKYLAKYVGVLGVPRIERCTFGDEQVMYGAAAAAINPPPPIARSAYLP